MIEEVAREIPSRLATANGKVFYSGHDAFQPGRQVYLLGYNPAGSPADHPGETVARHTAAVLTHRTPNWSAYRDEAWLGHAPGKATFQPVVLDLIDSLGLDPGRVPSSNLVFVRSPRATHLEDARELRRLCWPFHAKAIALIQPKFIVCLGLLTGRIVRRHLHADREIDRFEEPNFRHWISDAHVSSEGRIVVTLSHPSQAKWTTPETDPRPMARRVVLGKEANRYADAGI